MHKLEITGATPEDLYMNSVRMLSMLLKGGATTMPAEPAKDAPPVESAGAECQPQVAAEGASPSGADQTAEGVDFVAMAAKSKAKRGKAKAAEVPNDPLPDRTGAKTIEHEDAFETAKGAAAATTLTLDDDIRPRLRAIQTVCTRRGMLMPECVALIQKIYGPFGIARADQLKPESFVEFMEASEPYLFDEAYLSGEA